MWTEKKIESERDSGQAKQGDPKRQLVRPTISVLKAFARVVRGRHRFYRADLAILASHLYRGGQQISALSRKSPLGEAVATRARPGKVGFHRCATSVEIAGDEKWYEDWYLNDISKNALVSIASIFTPSYHKIWEIFSTCVTLRIIKNHSLDQKLDACNKMSRIKKKCKFGIYKYLLSQKLKNFEKSIPFT